MKKSKTRTTRRAIAYIRVSTGRQDISLADQEAKIRQYCELSDLELVEIIRERDVTAKIKLNKRPEGSRLARMLDGGIHHVVTLKLDRMFRNACDALTHVEEWNHAGVSLHLVDFSGMSINTAAAMGKFFLTNLAGFAELERNMISERTTAALAYKRKAGQVYNHVPYGFRAVKGMLVEDSVEQSVITRMRTLRQVGSSYWSIADELTAGGVPTKRVGGTWRPQTVKNILEASAVA
jgi:site-specific DNA recombinase